MLVIRLMRTGKKNQPFFRVVVTDKKNPSTAGRTTEVLGFYNPLTKEKRIDSERAKYWLSVGAKPSATAFNLLVSEKIIDGKKIPKHKKAKAKEGVVKTPEAQPAAAQPATSTEPPAEKTEAPVAEDKAEDKKEEAVAEIPEEKTAESAESVKPEEQPVSG